MSGENKNTDPSKRVELFVKSGIDGTSVSGCPLCQRVYMILLIKHNAGELTFDVTAVSMAKPPEIFKKAASRLPAFVHGDEVITDPDEILVYIDKHFPHPPMAYDNAQAAAACMDVFSKFSFFVKDVAHSSGPLIAELQKLNSYMESSPHKFLCRDESPDHLDCMMLPKLQHIRVIAKVFKDFDIPSNLKGVWRYLSTAYETTVFTHTCPADQEIVRHWMDKPEFSAASREKRLALALEAPLHYSFECPK